MLSRLRFTLLLPLSALIACGTSVPSAPTGTSSAPLGGDYVITVAAGTANASIFTGSLAVSGNTVTGVLRYNNPGTICVPGTQDIAFSGNFGNNVMTLTSAPFAGSVATLTINLPLGANSSGQQVASGTAVITGGTCVLASTTAQAQYIPSFAGTWSGTLTGPVAGTGTVVLTESAANADGQFPATGGATFSSSTAPQCDFSIPISAPLSGLVSGATLQVSNSTTESITASDATGMVSFSVSYNVTGTPSSCIGTYSGTLTN